MLKKIVAHWSDGHIVDLDFLFNANQQESAGSKRCDPHMHLHLLSSFTTSSLTALWGASQHVFLGLQVWVKAIVSEIEQKIKATTQIRKNGRNSVSSSHAAVVGWENHHLC